MCDTCHPYTWYSSRRGNCPSSKSMSGVWAFLVTKTRMRNGHAWDGR